MGIRYDADMTQHPHPDSDRPLARGGNPGCARGEGGPLAPRPDRVCTEEAAGITSSMRGAALIAGTTLVSRIMGFARDAATAYVLGAGVGADAFIVASRLPTFLRRMFGEGSMSMALVPVFTSVRRRGGDAAAFRAFRGMVSRVACGLTALCLGLVVFAPAVVALLAPGLSPEVGGLAASLLRVCAFYVLWVGLAGVCMGLLHSRGELFIPACAPVAFNVAMLAGAALAAFGPWRPEYMLACGVVAGGFAQLLVQAVPLLRAGAFRVPAKEFPAQQPSTVREGPFMHGAAVGQKVPDAAGATQTSAETPSGAVMDGRTAPLRMLSALGGVFGASAHQAGVLLSTMVASFLGDGGVASLYYAERLVEFPLGVFGVAIGTASLPVLASLHAAGRREHFETLLGQGVRLSLFVTLPAAAGLVAVAHPLVQVLFGHGAFDAAAVAGTVTALCAYAPGLPAFALGRTLLAATHARGDTRTPVLAALVSLAVVLVAGLALSGPLGVAGPPLAASLGAWCNTLLLHLSIVRTGTRCPLMSWGLATQGLLSVALFWLVGGLMERLAGLGAGWTLVLVCGVAAGCVFYALGAVVFRLPEWRECLAALRRRDEPGP